MPSKPTFSARRTSSRSSRRWPAMSPGGCCPRTIRLICIPPLMFRNPLLRRHSGATRSGEPGIHIPEADVHGFRVASLRSAPGMTSGLIGRSFRHHAFFGQFLSGIGVFVELQPHAAHHVGRLGELDVRVFDDLDAVAPGIEKIEERALDHLGAGRLGAFLDARAVVDDKTDMPPLDPGLLVVRDARQIDELVAHIDKGSAFAAAAQIELEDLAVPVQRLVDVADLDRDMVDADQPGLLAVAHLILPRGSCRHLSPTGPPRASAPEKFTTETTRVSQRTNQLLSLRAKRSNRP